jgi:antitoxin (DNA-binding transcriptional repressor) of toxin-antitoxin stability system
MERGTPVGRIVPLSPPVETRVRQLVEAGLVAWNGQRLASMASVARTQGQRTVADLVLEDRE